MSDDNMGKTEKIITETTENGRTQILTKTITKVYSSWNQMKSINRRILTGYIAISSIYLTIESYNEGKSELMRYRNKKTHYAHIQTEWDAVRFGCSNGFWDNLVGAAIWPVRIGSSLMPYLVLTFNPPDTDSSTIKK